MKVLVYSSTKFEKETILGLNKNDEFTFTQKVLSEKSATEAKGFDAICTFVNDPIPASIVEILAECGVKVILQRSAGFDRIDIEACKKHNIGVYYVPGYSAESVAEHGMSLLMALNRNLHIANDKVKASNYSLDGLLGAVIHGKTIGVIGGGRIGQCFINICNGLGAKVIVNDDFLKNTPQGPEIAKKFNFEFVSLDELLAQSDFISLHAFYTEASKHLINSQNIAKMKDGVIIINVARGGFIDTEALLDGLNSGKIRGAGLDVYEHESGKFFYDLSEQPTNGDEVLTKLQSHRNVLLTSHQAFLTEKALDDIFTTVFANMRAFENGEDINSKLA